MSGTDLGSAATVLAKRLERPLAYSPNGIIFRCEINGIKPHSPYRAHHSSGRFNLISRWTCCAVPGTALASGDPRRD
eukprot:904359-Rhodomonas_salina.2